MRSMVEGAGDKRTDRGHHSLNVTQDVPRRDPQHPVPVFFQESVPPRIP